MGKYILFGAGAYAKNAIGLLGKENIEMILDNDTSKQGTRIEGIPVCSPESQRDILEEGRVMLSVSPQYQSEIRQQLHEMGLENVKSIREVQMEITKKKIERRTDYIEIYNRAVEWIMQNTIDGHAIICHTDKRKGYPEVTGYYIPTLLRWGYRDLAVSYAKWLCSIQKEDGSWHDTDDIDPYVFDTAQILKGLLAIRKLHPEADSHIIRGCDWILGNVQESGRLTTPSTAAWGSGRECSELIHLYCLSPLVQAGETFGKPEYKTAAYRVLEYYKTEHCREIMNFGMLSHFYAYVMEGLLDMGERKLVEEAMDQVAKLQKNNGAVAAYKDVDWVCSTGLFQFALVWFRLGDTERGNRAFAYACKLQNESGGWYGSYLSEGNADEMNSYIPTSEISWAVKFFLDALYYKNHTEFNLWSDEFLEKIDRTDGRYRLVQETLSKERRSKNRPLKVLDAGCGKGRYLRNLLKDEPDNAYYAMDLSETVLEHCPSGVYKNEHGGGVDKY